MSDQRTQQATLEKNTSGSWPGRSTRDEMADRRRVVFQLRQMGHTAKQIAGTLGVSERSILRDLTRIRQEVTASLQPQEILDLVVDTILQYDTLSQEAFRDFWTAKPGSSQRGRAMRMVLRAVTSKFKFMEKMGLLPKGPIRMEDSSIRDHPAIAHLTPEERQRVADGLLRFFALLGDQKGDMLDLDAGDGQ